MYSNELLDEKYQAQAALFQQAKERQVDYVEAITHIAEAVFDQHGWPVRYAERQGGFLEKMVTRHRERHDIQKNAECGRWEKFQKVLEKVPDVEPEPYDAL